MDPKLSVETIDRLMSALQKGDRQATDKLVEIFYPELRRLANARMRGERHEHSWQPTLLVNELYLELIKKKALPAPDADTYGNSKATFFGLAALVMRRLLIQHARPLAAKAVRVKLEDSALHSGLEGVTDIESALSRLSAIRPRLRSIVELKVFEGMTLQEIADRLSCSTATVTREWNFTRHWLQEELAILVEN